MLVELILILQQVEPIFIQVQLGSIFNLQRQAPQLPAPQLLLPHQVVFQRAQLVHLLQQHQVHQVLVQLVQLYTKK